MFGRKQRTIDALRRRVDDLEERLCPCGAHEWVDTGKREYCIAIITVIFIHPADWDEAKRMHGDKLQLVLEDLRCTD